jgi:hypothetical protein
MTEIATVFQGVVFSDSLKNHIDTKNVSICQFLEFLDIKDIVKHVENNFYSDKDWHFRFDVGGMIKLSVVKFFRKMPYKKLVISEEEAYLLGFKEKDGIIQIPSGGALHHFVKYRLGVEGTDQIMMIVGRKIARLVESKDVKLDSTPLEASRYDKHSDYNPHYKCKMDKAHISRIGTHPVFMTYTDGVDGDSPQLPYHIDALLEMDANVNEFYLDGSYDSFQNHADIWCRLNAKPMISLPVDAVINEEGELKRIDHWANKMWKLGGSRHMRIDKKLRFLYENGRQDQVGMYLRNQHLKDKTFPDSCKLRSECERIHNHIKNTVKFDVRHIMEKSRELYTKFSFVVYQLLLLTNLKNRIKPANSFENYI